MKRCVDCNKYFEDFCTMDIAKLDDVDCLLKFQISELHRLNEALNQVEVVADGDGLKI